MFINNRCSIYADRPQTCRTYDCRIFPATGLSADHDKPSISQQTDRWKFTFPTSQDHKQFHAVQAAAKFLREHAESFPPGFLPKNPTQQAVVAIKVYEVFLSMPNALDNREQTTRTQEIVTAIIAAHARFAAGGMPN